MDLVNWFFLAEKAGFLAKHGANPVDGYPVTKKKRNGAKAARKYVSLEDDPTVGRGAVPEGSQEIGEEATKRSIEGATAKPTSEDTTARPSMNEVFGRSTTTVVTAWS
jgi:hypothetical protein